ncbi:ABC transporter ATP-binding protein/permease [Streptomyces scopuliridis]|uniref:ABC transporter ATP-binding protein/permease n=1 Tax=Streptomyces scopuliridis TaxID=452529 RepID=A0ACD4ZDC9_9ACTN|nr:ABC transporter ATP-binding protein [Streptomyces scopuliridis]WSB96265.1 ABC transporter ATP-binding protein/permease [Streptomyces scopuliridis]WSC10029.1 ABC transporter ATP-binding protein/permease [Streptomyces scopuliridis]
MTTASAPPATAETPQPPAPAQTPEPPATPPLRVLLRYARPHRTVLLATLLLVLAASAAGLVQPLVAQHVLDGLSDGRGVLGPVLLLAALVVLGAGLTGLQSWWQQRTSERVVRQIRRDLVFRLIRLRVPELDRRPPGDLISRVTSDSALVQNAATEGLVMVSNGVLSILGAVVLMGVVHLGLLGVTAAVLIAVALVMVLVLPRIREAVARAQESVGAVGAALDRTLGAARTVKANGAEGRETERAGDAIEGAYRAGLAGARYVALVKVLSGVSIQAAFLAVLGVGGALVAAGSLEASALIAFLLYVFYLASPVGSLVAGLSMLQQGLGAVGRIEQVKHMPVEDDVDDPRERLAAVAAPGAPPVEFRDVRFSYPGRAPALRGISYTVPGGTQTALVGLSGAGKTTMFALLQRFHEPASGQIRIDGVDIATLPRSEVRRRIAYVEQESPVMAGTIEDNLRYAATGASDEDIAEVLRLTRLDTLIDRLPDGLRTEVGNRGVTLSGGERQRLAIARALLRRPEVLLLDEATAQLDASNERALREAVDQAARRCTVILIAHRLSTVTGADQIVVLEHGLVRAAGTHAELVEADVLYRELASSQMLVSEGNEDIGELADVPR